MSILETAPEEVRRHHRLLLYATLILAALLRVWSLDFGLSHSLARPDETEIVNRSLLFLTGDLHPRFFHYGTLYFYLVGGVFAVGAAGLALVGQSLNETFGAAAVDVSLWLLMARAVSVVAGVCGVAAVYLLGRAFGGVRVGLMSALFLAIAPLHVRDSHFATTDVTLTLFITLAALFVLRSYRSGAVRDFAWAGALSGLAMSVKYVGLLMPGAIAAAYLLRLNTLRDLDPRSLTPRVLRDPRTWGFTAAMVLAFLATSPYALLDSSLFLEHFGFQLNHLADGHGVDLGIGGIYHLRNTFPLGVGWPVFLVAIAGGVLTVRERWREALVLLAFPLLFYGSTFTSQTLFLRYMLPILPFVCILAAVGTVHLLDRVSPERVRVVTVVILLLLAVEPISRDVRLNTLLGRTDSRVLATAWLENDAPDRAVGVHQTGEHWAHLELPAEASIHAEVAERLQLPANTPEAQRRRDFRRAQAEALRDDARARGFGFVPVDSTAVVGGERPEYIVILESDLIRYSRVPELVRDVVAAEYERVHHTPGVPVGGTGWYDQHDAFYLPFASFDGVARPGPDVTVYRRRSPP